MEGVVGGKDLGIRPLASKQLSPLCVLFSARMVILVLSSFHLFEASYNYCIKIPISAP